MPSAHPNPFWPAFQGERMEMTRAEYEAGLALLEGDERMEARHLMERLHIVVVDR